MNLSDPFKKVEKVVGKPSGTSMGSYPDKRINGSVNKMSGVKGEKFINDESKMNLATLKFKEASNIKVDKKEKTPMSKAPGTLGKKGSKDIDNEKNMKLGELKGGSDKKAKSVSKFNKMKLGELPGDVKKTVNKPKIESFGELKQNQLKEAKEQKNQTFYTAPGKATKVKGKNLAKFGDNLAQAPGKANHNGKKFHDDLKKSNLSVHPGVKGATKGNTLKMLNGKVKRSK